jgi:glycosyltransferase involved in cell wall biosynthesis
VTETPRDPTSVPQLPFSLLLPVYAGDRAEFLHRAFDSATAEQTRRPDEAVIVRDGPVGAELDAELADIQCRSVVPVTVVALSDNVGLARALEAGLAQARNEVIARADADDVSQPDRFARQLPVIEAGADLVGSALAEFSTDEHVTGIVRTMPTEPADIARYARMADPFNHPTVVFRKQAVADAGGYEDLRLMEDYLLFARMIAGGARVRNVPQVLVHYRVGAGAYVRRGGRHMLRSEIALQRALRREGFTTRRQYLRNLVVRGGYRVVPVSLRRWAYRSLLVTRKLPGVLRRP